MSADAEQVRSCQACGASVYPEHVRNHVAQVVAGRLLCRHCLAEQMGQAETIALDEPPAAETAPPPRIRHNEQLQGARGDESHFRRPLDPASRCATRCKTFHCRLTDASMAHLDEMINDWADARDDVHIKFATSTVGVVEGKHADAHLVVSVFY